MADTFRVILRGKAGADLSAAQNLFVYADGADTENLKLQTSDTAITTVGVLQNAPADNAAAIFVYTGFVDVVAGGTIEPFDLVGSNGSGQAIVAASTKAILGQYVPAPSGNSLPDAASGDLIRIYLFANKTRLVA